MTILFDYLFSTLCISRSRKLLSFFDKEKSSKNDLVCSAVVKFSKPILLYCLTSLKAFSTSLQSVFVFLLRDCKAMLFFDFPLLVTIMHRGCAFFFLKQFFFSNNQVDQINYTMNLLFEVKLITFQDSCIYVYLFKKKEVIAFRPNETNDSLTVLEVSQLETLSLDFDVSDD